MNIRTRQGRARALIVAQLAQNAINGDEVTVAGQVFAYKRACFMIKAGDGVYRCLDRGSWLERLTDCITAQHGEAANWQSVLDKMRRAWDFGALRITVTA